jgi:hypothetical protein
MNSETRLLVQRHRLPKLALSRDVIWVVLNYLTLAELSEVARTKFG